MIELIQQRLDSYKATNPVAEEQATREILQEVALYALWRAGFFEIAAFQGGTCLRILHGLPRFSEDLDFIIKEPDPQFDWHVYLEKLLRGLQEFGLQSEALDKSRMDQRVKKAVLKDNSVTNQLNLAFYDGRHDQKLKIKLPSCSPSPMGAVSASAQGRFASWPSCSPCRCSTSAGRSLAISAFGAPLASTTSMPPPAASPS